jgi:valyl-tRNA synthetase
MFMNLDRIGAGASLTQGAPEREMSRLENRWIMSRFYRVAGELNASLAVYRFHEAANLVYNFFWGEFCDWYLEIIKPRLLGAEEEARGALAFLGDVFEGALRLLSPFMPFITEEIWHVMYDGKPPARSIALVRFPESDRRWLNDEAERQMSILQEIIVNIRNIRAELGVQPKERPPARLFAAAEVRTLVEENRSMIERLAGVAGLEFTGQPLGQTPGSRTTLNFEVAVVYEQKVDTAADRERLTKELKKLEGEQANGRRQLGNEQFLGKAPANVVEGLRKRASEVDMLLEKIKTALAKLE